jgi:hypothetical protein
MEHGEQKIPDEFLSIADMYTISKAESVPVKRYTFALTPDYELRNTNHNSFYPV